MVSNETTSSTLLAASGIRAQSPSLKATFACEAYLAVACAIASAETSTPTAERAACANRLVPYPSPQAMSSTSRPLAEAKGVAVHVLEAYFSLQLWYVAFAGEFHGARPYQSPPSFWSNDELLPLARAPTFP